MSSLNYTSIKSRLSSLSAVLLATCLLAACSGGSGDPVVPQVGTSAGSTAGSSDGAVDGTLDGSTDETAAGSSAGSDSGTSDGGSGDTVAGSSDADSGGSGDGADSGSADGSSSGSSGASDAGSTEGGVIPPVDPTPIVRAPQDAQIIVSENLSLAGSVEFTGVPADLPVIQWIKLSGPGNAIFANSATANTSVSFDQAGTYLLELEASNGSYTSADQMQVVVTAVIVNQSPTVSVGPDETIKIDEVLNLSATIDDDGLPANTLGGTWSKASGPGEVTFGELTDENTTASFSADGSYVLTFTATDGELEESDQLKVTVEAADPVPNTNENINAANNWQNVNTANGSKPQSRHESAAVAYQGKLYLLGGRGTRQVNRYDPVSNRWENLGTPDFEMSHFQPVVYGGKIYVIGSLDCCFPSESVIDKIQIFNPANKKWSTGATIPQNRRRGSAGAVVYNNKIYIIGGSTNGHDGGMVNWFDEYNPATNTWKTLPSAPSKRDHFSAAIVGNKLVAAGGRQTDHPATFQNLVRSVDVYNFATGKWTSGANIPTQRAGAMTVSYGDEVILIGGEKDSGVAALTTVEAYNVSTNTWRTLDSLNTRRHSGGAAIVGGAIHVVSGNTTTGGGNETQAHEKLNVD